jgi:PD-(D/E)XK nuclease superfamily
MHIHFSTAFDGPVIRPHHPPPIQSLWVGPRQLLRWLEQQLGCSGWPERTDYLRIEMYRQALLEQVTLSTEPVFFAASFEADRFATAEALLMSRDELVLAGWTPDLAAPGRLGTFAAVELLFRKKCEADSLPLPIVGEADRWQRVLAQLNSAQLPIIKVVLYETLESVPKVIQRWLNTLNITPVQAQSTVLPLSDNNPQSPLRCWQARLLDQALPPVATPEQPDIVVLRARRDTDLAIFLAQTLVQNPNWQPTLLIPNQRSTLDLAFSAEGLPALGIPLASLARPALQVLKLAQTFLWEPVDVYKLMEFVTLPVKPLERGLALEIARVLAQKPGLYSDIWFAAVLGYLDQPDAPAQAKEQYEFWFNRRRYPLSGTAPKREAIAIYDYLRQWALSQAEPGAKDSSLLAVAEQARRISELLDMLPEQRISALELERIVRTIFEPAPMQLAEAEQGHLPYIHQPGACTGAVEELLWWNCHYHNEAPAPDFWQPVERQWLQAQQCAPDTPAMLAQRRLQARMRPILAAQRRIWLCVPDLADGLQVLPSLLLGDLEALPGSHNFRRFHIDRLEDRQALQQLLKVPDWVPLEARSASRPSAQLLFPPEMMTLRSEEAHETPTGLDSLFYYPHRWFLKQMVGIYPSNLLQVSRDNTLLGNLAHRFFELLLREDFTHFTKADVQVWVRTQAETLLEKEGATLLLYGREPERTAFLHKIQQAAWSLINLLRDNSWTVMATELDLNGRFGGFPIKGKADLVLQRDQELAIVDLKWSGMTRRKELIQNEEDLQLILYAHLLPPPEIWPHTAYFIIENGRMLARNPMAFREATLAGKGDGSHIEASERILQKMAKTFEWRMQQLKAGLLEIRTARTASELDALYGEALLELLEMKQEDAKWDDYRLLIEYM